jgi:hypothetical protein
MDLHMSYEKFEKDMAAFSFKQHQDVLTYLKHLKRSGWTIQDAESWVTALQKKSAIQSQKIAMPVFECSLCSDPMQLLPVNNTPGARTGDSTDNSVWICQNSECMHTIYNKETIAELSQRGK